MRLLHRPIRAGGAAVLGLATIALTGAFAGGAQASTAAPSAVSPTLITLSNSVPPTTDRQTGAFTASSMSVQVGLAPRDGAGLNAELKAVYTEGSGQYDQFLSKGQFDAKYAPTTATTNAVAAYLRSQGLTVSSTDSPFLLQASGSSAKITAAFHTNLRNYVDRKGTRYFSNSASVRLPASIASAVSGVVGLTNTVRLQSLAVRPAAASKAGSTSSSSSASCETGYVTTAELFDLVTNNVGFDYGYGGGPGCGGLTPSQTNSMYGAPSASPRTEGAGVTAAVFELSAYQESDIDTWATHYYGKRYTAPLENVTVDGGPLAPVCPTGDTCPAEYNGYSSDIEVDADIEMTLAVAPDVSHLIVYNAPNDYTGQTELDEYTTIANQDVASTISSSWGSCENDVTAGYVQSENTIFEQMALQGQSVFSSAGDTGRVRLHPRRRHHGRQRQRPGHPAVGDQRRRHLVRGRQPRREPAPGRAGQGHRDGLERRQPLQRPGGRRGQRRRGRLLLVRRDGRGRRRFQPVLGPSLLPARTGREQPDHHLLG